MQGLLQFEKREVQNEQYAANIISPGRGDALPTLIRYLLILDYKNYLPSK